MRPRWIKIRNDLWLNKTRTLLVVLSIMVGVAAVGAIGSIQTIMQRDLQASYERGHPSSAVVFAQVFQDETVNAVRELDGVKEAIGRYNLPVRAKVGENRWQDLTIHATKEYIDMKVDTVIPQSGAWPPDVNEIVIERASLATLGVTEGDTLVIETPDRRQWELRVSGTAYDVTQFPVAFTGISHGYIAMETLERLGQPQGYNELAFIVATNPTDEKQINIMVDKVQDRLRETGKEPITATVLPPGKHPASDGVQSLLFLLGTIGILTLGLSAALIINTISAIMAEQKKQIGAMKGFGALRSQLVGLYLTIVLLYGFLALLLAVPVSAAISRSVMNYMADLLNIEVASHAIPLGTLVNQFALGMIFPVVVAVFPIMQGCRLTVRDALSDYGGSQTERPGLLDRGLSRFTGLSRPVLLALRNSIRQKGRLLRTVATFALAGAMFISVLSVGASARSTVDSYLAPYNYDVQLNLEMPELVTEVSPSILEVAGVTAMEGWSRASAGIFRSDGSIGLNNLMCALPPDTEFLRPVILEGRWLQPGDTNAVVVGKTVVRAEKDIKVGSNVKLKVGGRESIWHVVGIAEGNPIERNFYVSYNTFSKEFKTEGRANSLIVRLDRHDAETQVQAERNLRERLEGAGVRVVSTRTVTFLRRTVESQFSLIVNFLFIVSLLLSVVGALGLMGTMSINVLERTREIGVLRAIGGSTGSIMKIVMIESVLVATVSWALGSSLAYPLSSYLNKGVGVAFTGTPFVFVFSVSSTVVWLAVILGIAVIASLLPAWRASRLSIREVLAYQ